VAMRLKEEAMACRNEEEREREEEEEEEKLAQTHQQQLQWCTVGAGFPQQLRKVVVVGYALTSKKTKSFLQPKLEGLAR
jgi:inositol-1,3,4-trisphosphate 5/6-kinase/inositol-tetrakisphosphate 1-kinase